MKKKERQTGKNYVYEQVTFEKRKNLYSTSQISYQTAKPQELEEVLSSTMYSQSEARTKNGHIAETKVINPRRIVDYLNKGSPVSMQPKASSLPSTTKTGHLRNQSSPQGYAGVPEITGGVTFPVSRGAQSHSPKAIAARIYDQGNPMNMRQTGV